MRFCCHKYYTSLISLTRSRPQWVKTHPHRTGVRALLLASDVISLVSQSPHPVLKDIRTSMCNMQESHRSYSVYKTCSSLFLALSAQDGYALATRQISSRLAEIKGRIVDGRSVCANHVMVVAEMLVAHMRACCCDAHMLATTQVSEHNCQLTNDWTCEVYQIGSKLTRGVNVQALLAPQDTTRSDHQHRCFVHTCLEQHIACKRRYHGHCPAPQRRRNSRPIVVHL